MNIGSSRRTKSMRLTGTASLNWKMISPSMYCRRVITQAVSFQKTRPSGPGSALETPERRIFYSGDSGYGPHFKKIGETFQGFDLVLLDAGQYDSRWALIHMTPAEAAQAAEDLQAKALIPAHAGRFAIANHCLG